MRARDLMSPVPELRPDDHADALVRAFDDPNVRVVAVTTSVGELVGVVTDGDLLDALLPSYILAAERLAGVLDEKTADTLRERLANKRVRDLVEMSRGAHPRVSPDDTLVETAAALARSRDRAVLVMDAGRVMGAVNVDRLLQVLTHPKTR